jgi:hypothetical protein
MRFSTTGPICGILGIGERGIAGVISINWTFGESQSDLTFKSEAIEGAGRQRHFSDSGSPIPANRPRRRREADIAAASDQPSLQPIECGLNLDVSIQSSTEMLIFSPNTRSDSKTGKCL